MNYNNTYTSDNIASDNIDNIAQSFFAVLIFCSLVSDSYILCDAFLNNEHIKKKINYCNKIYRITVDLFFNNYEKDSEGNIIINKNNIKLKKKEIKKNINDNTKLKEIKDISQNQIKSKNPFDDEYENNIIEKNNIEIIKNEVINNKVSEKEINKKEINKEEINKKEINEEEINKKKINEEEINEEEIIEEEII
jgi:hypothetical protein